MSQILKKSLQKKAYVYLAGSDQLKCKQYEAVRYKIGYTTKDPIERISELNIERNGKGYGSIKDWRLIKNFEVSTVQKAIYLEALLKVNFYKKDMAQVDEFYLNKYNVHEIYKFRMDIRERDLIDFITNIATGM